MHPYGYGDTAEHALFPSKDASKGKSTSPGQPQGRVTAEHVRALQHTTHHIATIPRQPPPSSLMRDTIRSDFPKVVVEIMNSRGLADDRSIIHMHFAPDAQMSHPGAHAKGRAQIASFATVLVAIRRQVTLTLCWGLHAQG